MEGNGGMNGTVGARRSPRMLLFVTSISYVLVIQHTSIVNMAPGNSGGGPAAG